MSSGDETTGTKLNYLTLSPYKALPTISIMCFKSHERLSSLRSTTSIPLSSQPVFLMAAQSIDLVLTGQLLWRDECMGASWAMECMGLVFVRHLSLATDQFRIPKASRRLHSIEHFHSATTVARIWQTASVATLYRCMLNLDLIWDDNTTYIGLVYHVKSLFWVCPPQPSKNTN